MAIFTAESFTQAVKSVLDKYAFHRNQKSEIDSVTEKTSPASADVLLIEDSADSFSKKKVQVSNFTFGSADTNAVHVNASSEINGVTTKATPVSADVLLVEDSAASFAKKKVTLSSLPTPSHTHAQSEVTSLVAALAGKKADFSENTGFNKNFGSTAGTTSEGNHGHPQSAVVNLVSDLAGKEPVFAKNTGFNKNFGATASDVSAGNHLHTGVYEPAFTKNTGFNLNLGTAAATVSEGDHLHGGVYEPAFTKNTAFNKNFGAAAGAVSEGNHSHFLTLNDQIGTAYILVLTDQDGVRVRMNNAAANTMTVPPASSVAFSIGAEIQVEQVGAGATTIVAGAGVTVNAPLTLVLSAQYGVATLTYIGSDVWGLSGDLV